jgi:hypothetical protein
LKKQVFLLLFIAATIELVQAQSACDNHNHMKGNSALGEEAKFAKTYWAKRCACETGAITGGTWEYSVEIMNRMYDLYQKPSTMANYQGASFPIPDKRMHVTDCKSDHNFNITPDISDCTPNTFDNSKDPQQYGNAFMLARCECVNGVPNAERAKQLEATMKINFQNAKSTYGNSLSLPQPLSWSECPIIEFGGIQGGSSGAAGASAKRDRWAMYKDDLINADARDLIGQLAAESNNPDLKRLSQDLNNLAMPNQQLANYNEFFNITPTQADMEFQQVMTNAAQGVAVLRFIWNSVDRKIKEKKEAKRRQLAWEKKQGDAAVQRIWQNLLALHREAAKMPSFKKYDEMALAEIDKMHESFYAFDIATAPERKFLIEYFYGDSWFTVSQIKARVEQLTNMDRIDLLREIDAWQKTQPDLISFAEQFDANKAASNTTSATTIAASMMQQMRGRLSSSLNTRGFRVNSQAHAILANADVSFARTELLAREYKSICYLNLGDTAKAMEFRDGIDDSILEKELFTEMREAVKSNDKSSIEMLLPQLKVYLERKRLSGNLSRSDDEYYVLNKILTEETVLLFCEGVRNSIENGNLKSAESEILFLKQGLGMLGETQDHGSWEMEKISAVEALEAMLLSKKGKMADARKLIDQAIAHGRYGGPTKFWKGWVKFNLLVEMKEYDAAHLWYNEVIKDFSYTHHGDAAMFDINELKFAKCELLYEQGEYDRVLKGLSMLETAKPNIKYNQLRYKVYLKQGDQTKADLELEKIGS